MPLIMNGVTIPTNVANVLNYNGTNITSVIFNGTNVWTQSLNFTANFTISSNTTYYNIRTALINAGWNQSTPVVTTVTINSGIYVYATSTGSYAMETGSLPAGSSVNIVNNGYIIGKGGDGGGGSGGPALNINYPCSITNNSYIAGGGGAGGGSFGGGGAGGGNGGSGASGGGPGASGGNGGTLYSYSAKTYTSYGAGGGRILPGSGGQGSRGFWTNAYGGGAGGGGGAVPYVTEDSFGGDGGSANSAGGYPSLVRPGRSSSGGGGGWGASGGGGYNAGPGSGGKAVNLNGNSVTWVATGNRYGSIS